VPFSGEAFSNLGGSESRGPPDGGTILAQEGAIAATKAQKQINRMIPASFMNRKHKPAFVNKCLILL
jgi:hypothetical protein